MLKRRPDLFYRFLATGCDLALAISLCFLVRPFGTVMGIIYILLKDGFFRGASPFKWLFGLRTVDRVTDAPATFKTSVLRNLPFALAASLLLIPVLGIVLALIVGLLFLGVESYFLYSDPESLRLGDVLADSKVIRSRGPQIEEDEDDDDGDDDDRELDAVMSAPSESVES